jgi:hypothetical protein
MTANRQARFNQYKDDYAVYGTHEVLDQYRNKSRVKDTTPRGTIHVMWQPATDSVSLAEYGEDINRVYFALVYDETVIEYGDVINVHGEDCEVVAVKEYNTYRRVDVRRKKAGGNNV